MLGAKLAKASFHDGKTREDDYRNAKELGGYSILTEARVGDGTTVLHLRTGVVLMQWLCLLAPRPRANVANSGSFAPVSTGKLTTLRDHLPHLGQEAVPHRCPSAKLLFPMQHCVSQLVNYFMSTTPPIVSFNPQHRLSPNSSSADRVDNPPPRRYTCSFKAPLASRCMR